MEKVAYRISFGSSKNGRLNNIKYQISNIKDRVINKTPLIFLVLLIAGFLRLYRIEDYMTFLGDEGRDVLVVYNILHGHLTLLGPAASVGGFFLGPIYYYFMTPFLWLSHYNPVGPAVMVALFGIATVWLVYKVGSEFLGHGVGFIAAILYSISPLVIAYSRSSWNPNLMPFFSLLSLYVLYKAVNENKIKLFIVCGLLLGIAIQFHYLSIFLGAIIATYVLLTRSLLREGDSLKKVFKSYILIFFGFLIGWSPFLAFEVRHDFPNIKSIINFVLRGEETGGSSRFFAIVENVFFRIFGRLVTNFPPPEQVSLQAHFQIAVWYYLTLSLALLSTVVLAYTLLRRFRDQKEFPKISLLVVWLVVGVGLFGFYKKPIYDYYFGFMFPLPFLLVGLTISSLYTNVHQLIFSRHSGDQSVECRTETPESLYASRASVDAERFWTRRVPYGNPSSQNDGKMGLVGKVLAVGVFLSIAWINLQGMPFRYPPNRQLAQVEEISRFVVEKTDNKPFNFALITGGNSDHAYRYFFTLWGRQPVTIDNPQKDPERKTVTEQLLVVCETSPCAPLGHSLWEIAGFGRAEIVGEWSVSVVKVYKLIHYMGDVNKIPY